MKEVGFIKSRKENEKRAAIDIEDISKVNNKKMLFFLKKGIIPNLIFQMKKY